MAKKEVLFNCILDEFDKLVFEFRPYHSTSAGGVRVNNKMIKALIDYFSIVVSEDREVDSDIAYIRDKIFNLFRGGA